MKIICPYCNQSQKKEAKKTWSYGKMIEKRTKEGTVWGSAVTCSMYTCKCEKPFRFYFTTKGKSWTIPKSKTNA